MICNKLPRPEQVRVIPKQFSWVDQKFVQGHYIDHCDHQALALYLFLITVADYQGVSYYADNTLMNRLQLDVTTLEQARSVLCQQQLIAYQTPFYQVLSLPIPKRDLPRQKPVMQKPLPPHDQSTPKQVKVLIQQLRESLNG